MKRVTLGLMERLHMPEEHNGRRLSLADRHLKGLIPNLAYCHPSLGYLLALSASHRMHEQKENDPRTRIGGVIMTAPLEWWCDT